MKKIIISVFFLVTTNNVFAQNTSFSTNKGHALVFAVQDKNQLIAETNALFFSLDYFKTTFKAYIHLQTLETGVDSLDKELRLLPVNSNMFFDGKANLNFINNKKHAPLEFNFEGKLTLNNITKQIIINAQMTHIADNSNFSCVLNGSFKIKLSEFNINLNSYSIYDEVEIKLSNLILRSQ